MINLHNKINIKKDVTRHLFLFILQNKTQCVIGINENWFEFDALCSTKKKRPWVVFLLSNTDSNACNRALLTLSKRRPRGHRWRPSLRAGLRSQRVDCEFRLSPPQSTRYCAFFICSTQFFK